jgi:hypothetical protein
LIEIVVGSAMQKKRDKDCDNILHYIVPGTKLELSCFKNCKGDTVFAITERDRNGNVKEVKFLHEPLVNYAAYLKNVKTLATNPAKRSQFRKLKNELKRDNLKDPESRQGNLGRCEFQANKKSQEYYTEIINEQKNNLQCSRDTEGAKELRIGYQPNRSLSGQNGFVGSIASRYPTSDRRFPSEKFEKIELDEKPKKN